MYSGSQPPSPASCTPSNEVTTWDDDAVSVSSGTSATTATRTTPRVLRRTRVLLLLMTTRTSPWTPPPPLPTRTTLVSVLLGMQIQQLVPRGNDCSRLPRRVWSMVPVSLNRRTTAGPPFKTSTFLLKVLPFMALWIKLLMMTVFKMLEMFYLKTPPMTMLLLRAPTSTTRSSTLCIPPWRPTTAPFLSKTSVRSTSPLSIPAPHTVQAGPAPDEDAAPDAATTDPLAPTPGWTIESQDSRSPADYPDIDDGATPAPSLATLSIFPHNAATFCCVTCDFVAPQLAELRAHRDRRHLGIPFMDIFHSGCACAMSFVKRASATRHTLYCGAAS
ncbi:unnamed protein product [Hyaloperonospora brassicae]|uniref:C2H2-type domain-containing protein n=1 Tax=Hyaloperonospora brassicae TaxID=162125 RepID=A0AAV0TLD4_HYABA|nr:unnamed protein product [Hyaloperonospora brassicae]